MFENYLQQRLGHPLQELPAKLSRIFPTVPPHRVRGTSNVLLERTVINTKSSLLITFRSPLPTSGELNIRS